MLRKQMNKFAKDMKSKFTEEIWKAKNKFEGAKSH